MTDAPRQLAVRETLASILVPGGRSRISPFIESTQVTALLGQSLHLSTRNEDIQRIVGRSRDRIADLASKWVQFAAGGRRFNQTKYSTDDFLDQYLAYYMPTNVSKVQLCLLSMVERELIPPTLTLIDFGVGTATTALATVDFMIAWATACALHDVQFPVADVRITGFDISDRCLERSRQVANVFADVLAERRNTSPENSALRELLQQAENWLRDASWENLDLNTVQPKTTDGPALVVASNILNELGARGKEHLASLVASLPDQSSAIVMEPGDKRHTHALNQWWSDLLVKPGSPTLVAPCHRTGGSVPPSQCARCWNARRESFHQPALYQAFRRAASEIEPDDRPFGNFENYLLSWSYCILSQNGKSDATRVATDGHTTRFIGRFRSHGAVPSVPDDDGESKGIEYIKVCPCLNGRRDLESVLIRRPAGFLTPPLVHGERVVVRGMIENVRSDNCMLMDPATDGDEASAVELVSQRERTHEFVVSYSEQVRHAVDEIGHRLFGFERMRPFQHEILARVMTGRSILAIAATGGGKSECYILPAMLLPGLTVVVSPLKSLMQDQYDARISRRYGLGYLATYINGDVPFKERQARLKRMELGYYKLVYFTPEQLRQPHVLNSLQRTNAGVGVRYIALDEAHCISQWGHDFRDSYLSLVHRLRRWGIDPVRIALTATASPEVRKDLCEELDLANSPLSEGGDVFVHASNRPELNLIVRRVDSATAKADDIARRLKDLLDDNEHNEYPGAAIVFTPLTGTDPDRPSLYMPGEDEPATKGKGSGGATDLASFLERALRQRVSLYHGKMDYDAEEDSGTEDAILPLGDLSKRGRRTEQDAFMGGETSIMVATKGFGMGIDKPNIRLIAHRTPPGNLEAYAQEAGRAGRDGEIADVVLFYTPGRTTRDLPATDWSDYHIQDFFLSQKYIRREDVIAMRKFLLSVERKVGDYLFFSSDEAIPVLDHLMDWPPFPPRRQRGFESESHSAILNRGHLYSEKTRYIDRVLSALYRIRPQLSESGIRVSMVDSFQESGARLFRADIVDADAIVNSNAYFGELLRSHGIDGAQLAEIIQVSQQRDFLEIALRLGLSPSETCTFFWDMNKADGRIDGSGRWRSNLLRLSGIGAPRYGAAVNRNTLQSWRDYAGATRRANKSTAYDRAARAGRPMRTGRDGRQYPETTDDDWFYWRELTRPKSWEVLPGPALTNEARFETYLDRFMELHDERKRNDRAAYTLLLTDYVGASDDGSAAARSGETCLRSVLLGYLKTGEVVTGGNCRSCSSCVPNGAFETDLTVRRSLVSRLSDSIITLLDEIEAGADALPSQDDTDSFWHRVAQEEAAGRSIRGYVIGLSGRLITETPSHQAALWLRVTGMLNGHLEMQQEEAVQFAGSLVKHVSDHSLDQLAAAITDLHERLPHSPSALVVQADLLMRQGHATAEAEKRNAILEHAGSDDEMQYAAHEALCRLHAANGPIPDEDAHAQNSVGAARAASSDSKRTEWYAQVVPGWDCGRLTEEATWLSNEGRPPAIHGALVTIWVRSERTDTDYEALCAFLGGDAGTLSEWKEGDVEALLQRVPTGILREHPVLIVDAKTSHPSAAISSETFIRAVLVLLDSGLTPGEETMRAFAGELFEGLEDTDFDSMRTTILSPVNTRTMILRCLEAESGFESCKAICRWFALFGDVVDDRDTDSVAAHLHLLTEKALEAGPDTLAKHASSLPEHMLDSAPRLQRLAEFSDLLRKLCETNIAKTTELRACHLDEIPLVFNPSSDVSRADMAAAVIGAIRS